MVCMDTFSALAESTRRKIFELLAQKGELPASEIAGQFSVSPQAISQHLKTLRDAGLVQVEKRAQQRIYSINPEAMQELEVWSRKLRELWERRFDAIDQILVEEQRKEKQDG
jgi:DNA-binding transcriptional ArsR family regulator